MLTSPQITLKQTKNFTKIKINMMIYIMTAGAPRTVSPCPEEMIKLGQEMVQWVKDHPEILHLSEWYTIEKMYTYNQWKQFINKEEFHPYYEVALKLVGKKYLDKTSNVREGISQRWQRSYFKDLRESEDEDMDAEVIRKKAIEGAKQTTYNIMVPHDLAAGSNISAQAIPEEHNKSAK
jgi:hypothetical protein